MTRLRWTACTLLLCTASAAHAAEWRVDPAKSSLAFTGTQTQVPFTGRFKSFKAAIAFDPAKPDAATVSVTVDLSSVTTGDPQKDEALPGTDWFDTGSAATATFEGSGFRPQGGDAFETTGKLTLRGISKDVTLPFHLTLAGDTAHAVGRARLVRTDFGVGQGAWSTGDMVGLDVVVDIDIVATKH